MANSDSARSTHEDEDELNIDRRKLLATTSGALTVGLAGCPTGGSGSQTTTGGGTPTPQPDPPVIVDATLPPTGVEVDEQIQLDITIDVSPANQTADKNDVVITGDADLIRRGTELGYGAVSASTNVVELGTNRLRLEYTFEAPNSAIQWVNTNHPQGLGYRLEVNAVYGASGSTWGIEQFAGQSEILGPGSIDQGSQGPHLQFMTWAFDNVDTVAMVPAVASDENPSPTNVDLYYQLRRNAEKTARYYASEMGSMGAMGFDMTTVTRTNDDPTGWVSLPDTTSQYETAANNARFNAPERFTEDALDAAANNLGVDFSQWDMAAVLTDNNYGRAFYRGDFVSTPVEMDLGLINVEVATSGAQNLLPISGYDTPTGRTDYWWDQVDGNAWLHELGHSLGPGNQVGLPDLYQMQVGNLGVIHNWGQMGSAGGDVLMSWCRQLGGDFFNPRNWLTKADHMHIATDTTIELDPLTEKEIGDHAAQLTTMWGEFQVSIQWTPTGWSASLAPQNVHLRSYVLEARPGGKRSGSKTQLEDPGTRNELRLSPSADDGIAIYRFGKVNLQGSIDVQAALSGNDPVQFNTFTPIDLQFLDPASGNEDQPTLSQSKSTQYETRRDAHSVMTFEQTGQVSGGSPQVEVRRNPQTITGAATAFIAQHFTSVAQWIENQLQSLFPGGPPVEIPGIDILATTPDGRRAGIDPETGEIYEEIEGARVTRTGVRQELLLPGDVEVSVELSSARLRAALADRGVDVPERIPHTQEVVLTADPSIDDERSMSVESVEEPIPHIQGRTRQTHERTVGPERTEAVVTPTIEMDVRPEGVSEAQLEELLFVDLTFEQPIDPETIALETAALGSIPALQPADRDAVPFPLLQEGPEARVRLTFDRLAVEQRFGEGEQNVFVSGAFDRTAFYAPATIELTGADGGQGGFEDATVLSAGEHGPYQISNGESHYYAVELMEGEDLTATISFEHAQGDLDLAVHGPDTSQLKVSATTTDNETVTVVATESGTYYVRPYGFDGASNEYQLTIEIT